MAKISGTLFKNFLTLFFIIIAPDLLAKVNMCEKIMLEKGLNDFVRNELIVSQNLIKKFTPEGIMKNGFLGKGFITEEKITLDLLKYLKSTAESDSKLNFWEVAVTLGKGYSDHIFDFNKRFRVKELIDTIVRYQSIKAHTSKDPTTVVFGTSGWREEIGEGFTVFNVHKVVRGIIEMMKSDEFLKTNGYKSFNDVKKAGIVVFRDNRLLGEEFYEAGVKELTSTGIRVFEAGETPTGVGSSLVTELKAAGSINFTPSHNPMSYAGLKFNPGDGGPADQNLTSIIEVEANKFMKDTSFYPANPPQNKINTLTIKIDSKKIFNNFIEKNPIFGIKALRAWLTKNSEDIDIVVDYMHGSARGYIEYVLGDKVIKALKKSDSFVVLNNNSDITFHGAKPEPNAKNQMEVMSIFRRRLLRRNEPLKFYEGQNRPQMKPFTTKKYTLGVSLDPDGDRIRFSDNFMDIDMNKFGAIAYANLLSNGFSGGVAKSAPTSNFVLESAKANDQPIFETKVGFKHFRPHPFLIAFEESDGMTVRGHTLEKCAISGFLLALKAIETTEKNLSTQYFDLQKEYGYFYPFKAGVDVKGVSVEEWQIYKGKVVKALQDNLVKKGNVLKFEDLEKRVSEVNTIDGLKIIFDDRSWIQLRPSGTEPKFRIYGELVSQKELYPYITNSLEEKQTLMGEQILDSARKKIK